jgi:hypothetical protein
VIRKLSGQPWYKVWNGGHDTAHLQEAVIPFVANRPMTDEEASWEGWDFDSLFGITSYTKILSKLKDSIKRIDAEFKEHYLDELETYAAEEKAKAPTAADRAAQFTNITTPAPTAETALDDALDIKAATEAPKEVKTRAPLPATPPAKAFDWGALAASGKYPGLGQLTDEEKSWVTSVGPDGALIWDTAAGDLILDAEDKKTYVPERVHVNPYSGRVYEALAA